MEEIIRKINNIRMEFNEVKNKYEFSGVEPITSDDVDFLRSLNENDLLDFLSKLELFKISSFARIVTGHILKFIMIQIRLLRDVTTLVV